MHFFRPQAGHVLGNGVVDAVTGLHLGLDLGRPKVFPVQADPEQAPGQTKQPFHFLIDRTDRQFRGGDQGVVEKPRLCAVLFLSAEQPAQEAGKPRGQGQNQNRTEDVEQGVEQRQRYRRVGRQLQPCGQGRHQPQHQWQNQQGNQSGDRIEQDMPDRQPAGIGGCFQGRQCRR